MVLIVIMSIMMNYGYNNNDNDSLSNKNHIKTSIIQKKKTVSILGNNFKENLFKKINLLMFFSPAEPKQAVSIIMLNQSFENFILIAIT